MTTFKHTLQICGLSQREAASFLNVSPSSIDKWSRNQRAVPEAVWQELADLYTQVEEAADRAAAIMQVDGIDERAFQNISADNVGLELPEGSTNVAGAMALMIALTEG